MDGKILELSNEIDNIKTTVAAEKVEVAAKIAELESSITALEEQISNGGSQEDLQELINKARATIDEVKGIYNPPA